MSEMQEDTRDENQRFAEAYAALDGTPDSPEPVEEAASPDVVDDEAEWTPDDLADAADSPERADDDPEDTDPDETDPDHEPTGEEPDEEPQPRESKELAETKQKLNQANSELGRLRQLQALPQQLVAVQAEATALREASSAKDALYQDLRTKYLAIFQQAEETAPDEVTRNQWRLTRQLTERELADGERQAGGVFEQRRAEVQQQAAQQLEVQRTERYFREGAEPEMVRHIQQLARDHGLSREQAQSLWAEVQNPAFKRVVQQAPPREFAQTMLEMQGHLTQRAQGLAKAKTRANREQAVETERFRTEKPAATPARTRKPTEQAIRAKYQNTGDMQGMYAEMTKHGYI